MMAKNADRVVVSDREIDAAIATAATRNEPRAVSVRYEESSDRIVIEFDNGNALLVARANLQGLADATPAQLADVVIEGPGTGLHWRKLDVDHYVPSIVRGVFGTRRWMAELGRAGGASRSEAKAAAARKNGMRGGRPSHVARSAAQSVPDARYRDSKGTLLRKRGDTDVGTLRATYGSEFAAGFRSDMKLDTLLERTGAVSLADYLKRSRR